MQAREKTPNERKSIEQRQFGASFAGHGVHAHGKMRRLFLFEIDRFGYTFMLVHVYCAQKMRHVTRAVLYMTRMDVETHDLCDDWFTLFRFD